MAKNKKIYTYRNGKKIYLKKKSDEYVARALPEQLEKMGITKNVVQVSSASSKIKVKAARLDDAMVDMRKHLTAHHAYTVADDQTDFLITDRIVVTFKEAASHDEISTFMAKYALVLKRKYSDREFLFQLTNETGMNPVKLVVLITEEETGLVELCEHDLNHVVKTSSVTVPADPNYLQQWHLHQRLTDNDFDVRSSSNCEDAWNLLNHFGSPDVVIGVTDDGCKLDHPDFDSPGKFASWGYMSGLNLVHRDAVGANPANMYQSGSDHGTNCCGVVAAEVDALLTVGAAPGCRLLPVKWESSGSSLYISDDKLYTVLNFLQDKVDVISNSWGSSPHGNYASFVVNKIKTLTQTGGRRGKGVVFLWAAGNENCPINYTGNQDIPYTHGYAQRMDGSWYWAGVDTSRHFSHNLVGVPGVMFVAALASNAQRSHYSNYGTGISLTAPSSNLHKYYRMAVPGLGITTTSGASPLVDNEFGGTSSATPLVAGIAGLVISANPNLTALEVISVLQRTADKDLNMNGYPKTLPASYDPDTSWDISPVAPFNSGAFTDQNLADGTWSPWFGFGKVDAATAVAEALKMGGVTGEQPAGKVEKTSSPALAIPDKNSTGIADQILVEETGPLAEVQVEVDISHTYIGDLIVSLISPNSMQIDLHKRSGGSADNLKKTFDLQNTPALSQLNGQSIQGAWTLKVSDHAAIDTGTLNSWKLTLNVSRQTVVEKVDEPALRVPDNDPVGVERTIQVEETGTVKEIEVGIDITHTYIGDLIVNLSSPSGTQVNLHKKTGGTTDNLIKTYSMANTPPLAVMKGEQITGIWKLNVSDNLQRDTGKLNSWSIKILLE
ncbi:MAG: proprotein convertase P-domain-containing protein [Mangrovibacterium sp.]